MGMPVEVAGVPPAVTEGVYRWFAEVDRRFSPFLDDSWVGRVRRGLAPAEGEDAQTREVADLCRVFEAETDGCFSAWVGGVFDPTGLVKGWAIERAGEQVRAAGVAGSWWIEAGGDVLVEGSTRRRIGIRHPVEHSMVARVISLARGAVATSGSYLLGGHIVDPRQPGRRLELLSLTVVGPSIMTADVYATAGFVMGVPAALRFVSDRGYEAYAIDASYNATMTDGFAAMCVEA